MALQSSSQSGNENVAWKPTRRLKLAEEIIEISEPKSRLKVLGALARQITIVVAVLGLFAGIFEFFVQQNASNRQQAVQAQLQLTQEVYTTSLQATQQAYSAHLQATQQAATAAQMLDQQEQTILDTYLDRMSDLLLIYHLKTSQQGSSVQAIAEARTLTAIHYLDVTRRVALIRFLWRAGLVNGANPVISLNAAYIAVTPFANALLYAINLSGALLDASTFTNCDLHQAIFSGASLTRATLNNVDLTGAIFKETNLTGATLEAATLTGANFSSAILQNANLSGDDLTKVNLAGANLAGADLNKARITPAQLKQVASLQGAIMPDGSKHP